MKLKLTVLFVLLACQPLHVFTAYTQEKKAAPKIRVAVYDGAGTGRSKEKVVQALAGHTRFKVDRVKANDIRKGCLANYDVVVMPGGSGSGQAKSLGAEGREQIRAFVRRGGGYVGICAGAYLATSDYPWSLHILNARVVDRKHWARGFGNLEIALTPKGKKLLAAPGERLTIYYHQGPLLAPGADKKLPAYETLATFAGEIAKNGAPKGVMPGTTAIATASYGKGRVLCFSPHPELTEGLGDFLCKGITWGAGSRANPQKGEE